MPGGGYSLIFALYVCAAGPKRYGIASFSYNYMMTDIISYGARSENECKNDIFFFPKYGQDFENRKAHPHQEFPRVPRPSWIIGKIGLCFSFGH